MTSGSESDPHDPNLRPDVPHVHRVRTAATISGQTPGAPSHDAPTQTAHTTPENLSCKHSPCLPRTLFVAANASHGLLGGFGSVLEASRWGQFSPGGAPDIPNACTARTAPALWQERPLSPIPIRTHKLQRRPEQHQMLPRSRRTGATIECFMGHLRQPFPCARLGPFTRVPGTGGGGGGEGCTYPPLPLHWISASASAVAVRGKTHWPETGRGGCSGAFLDPLPPPNRGRTGARASKGDQFLEKLIRYLTPSKCRSANGAPPGGTRGQGSRDADPGRCPRPCGMGPSNGAMPDDMRRG